MLTFIYILIFWKTKGRDNPVDLVALVITGILLIFVIPLFILGLTWLIIFCYQQVLQDSLHSCFDEISKSYWSTIRYGTAIPLIVFLFLGPIVLIPVFMYFYLIKTFKKNHHYFEQKIGQESSEDVDQNKRDSKGNMLELEDPDMENPETQINNPTAFDFENKNSDLVKQNEGKGDYAYTEGDTQQNIEFKPVGKVITEKELTPEPSHGKEDMDIPTQEKTNKKKKKKKKKKKRKGKGKESSPSDQTQNSELLSEIGSGRTKRKKRVRKRKELAQQEEKKREIEQSNKRIETPIINIQTKEKSPQSKKSLDDEDEDRFNFDKYYNDIIDEEDEDGQDAPMTNYQKKIIQEQKQKEMSKYISQFKNKTPRRGNRNNNQSNLALKRKPTFMNDILNIVGNKGQSRFKRNK